VQDLSPLILDKGPFEIASPRLCKQCGSYLPVGGFYPYSRGGTIYIYHVCKLCHRQCVSRNRAKRAGTAPEIASRMYDHTKRRARARKVPFGLSREWFVWKIESGACELSRVPFYLGSHQRHPLQPSPDRIIPEVGYEEHNSRMILWMLNSAKGSSDEELFITCLRQVAEAILRAS
jgi:hypothetical protein